MQACFWKLRFEDESTDIEKMMKEKGEEIAAWVKYHNCVYFAGACSGLPLPRLKI